MRLFFRNQSETPQRRQSSSSRSSSGTPDVRQDYAFRRGRTLTGSVSSHVSTTNETQADLKSPRVHAHMLTKQRRHLSGLFFLSLLGALAFFVIIYQFTAQIAVQATPDPSLRLDDRYARAIDAYLSDHPAERLRFFMDTARLSDYVMDMAPEVSAVESVGSAGFGVSRFAVTLRTPIASWNINGKQLYVDENGVPFSRNYFNPPSLTVTDRSGIPVSLGQTVASDRFMGFVGQVIGLAKSHNHTVTEITIPPGMTRQVEVRLDRVGYPIKLSSDRPAGEGVEDMVRAVKWMKEKRLSPDYLDVRVKGKVFYR